MGKTRITIVVDTREQEPLSFDPAIASVERRALPAGDYSLVGLEERVAVERKSLDDLVSTVIRGRQRFARELERLQGYDAACVVVEANLADVHAGRYRSGAHPASVLGAVMSIIVDAGIPVFFCSDRQIACRFVEDYLVRFQRAYEESHHEPS